MTDKTKFILCRNIKTPDTNYLQASAENTMLPGGSLGEAMMCPTLRFSGSVPRVEEEEKKVGRNSRRK